MSLTFFDRPNKKAFALFRQKIFKDVKRKLTPMTFYALLCNEINCKTDNRHMLETFMRCFCPEWKYDYEKKESLLSILSENKEVLMSYFRKILYFRDNKIGRDSLKKIPRAKLSNAVPDKTQPKGHLFAIDVQTEEFDETFPTEKVSIMPKMYVQFDSEVSKKVFETNLQITNMTAMFAASYAKGLKIKNFPQEMYQEYISKEMNFTHLEDREKIRETLQKQLSQTISDVAHDRVIDEEMDRRVKNCKKLVEMFKSIVEVDMQPIKMLKSVSDALINVSISTDKAIIADQQMKSFGMIKTEYSKDQILTIEEQAKQIKDIIPLVKAGSFTKK